MVYACRSVGAVSIKYGARIEVFDYELDAASSSKDGYVQACIRRTGIGHGFYKGRLNRLVERSIADRFPDGLNDFSLPLSRFGLGSKIGQIARCSIVGHMIKQSYLGKKLRLWLSLDQADLRPMIERADRKRLFKQAAEVKRLTAALKIKAADITELWELVSAARHGDGPAAIRLRTLNPDLWSHQDVHTQVHYDKAGLRVYSIRVQNSDIERYFAATIDFWDNVSRH